MRKRVTIQDIADALGISRNTVSKAINNSDGLADATRERILQKATEMGYKQFSYITMVTHNLEQHENGGESKEKKSAFSFYDVPPEALENNKTKEIALFTRGFLGSSHFATTMLDKFQRELSQLGYPMTLHRLTSEEIRGFHLPPTFNRERTSGIMCVEIFDYNYAQMLCDLELPILFVDGPVEHMENPLPTDLLLMDNSQAITRFVKDMLSHGITEIGFTGYAVHCCSFMERYLAFRNAMFLYGGTIREEFCIIGSPDNKRYPRQEDYRRYLKEELSRLDHLPQVFICTNDFNAMDMLFVCRELGISVPEDVMICGFDDAPESKVISPSLTTIHIHSQIMGLSAVQMLMARIKEPNLNFRTVHTESTLIYRESASFQDESSLI